MVKLRNVYFLWRFLKTARRMEKWSRKTMCEHTEAKRLGGGGRLPHNHLSLHPLADITRLQLIQTYRSSYLCHIAFMLFIILPESFIFIFPPAQLPLVSFFFTYMCSQTLHFNTFPHDILKIHSSYFYYETLRKFNVSAL